MSVRTETSETTPYWIWIPTTIIGFALCCATIYIFIREQRKRQNTKLIVVSKYLSFFSFLCISTGTVFSFCVLCWYINGICYIAGPLSNIAGTVQPAAMECFQLSRLYYCFSQQKVHSDKGYPKWIFVIMYSTVFVWAITNIVAYVLWPIECGIQSDGTAKLAYYELLDGDYLFVLRIINGVLLVAMDAMTVLLYWCRIRSFKQYQNEKNNDIYTRILSILHRMLILTYLYLITTFSLVVMVAISGRREPFLFNPFVYSISMYLMMDHNTLEYIQFLRIINRLKLYLCCCCCYQMVLDEYQLMVPVTVGNKNQTNTAKKNIAGVDDSRDVTSASANANNIIMKTGMELSIDTRTEYRGDEVNTEGK